MGKRNTDFRLGEEDNESIVIWDKNSPSFKRAKDLVVIELTKERVAQEARILAQASQNSEVGETASGSWGEMPRLGREHEASLLDVDPEGDDTSGAENTAFDDDSSVTAC